jgi:hypothetical protein
MRKSDCQLKRHSQILRLHLELYLYLDLLHVLLFHNCFGHDQFQLGILHFHVRLSFLLFHVHPKIHSDKN